MRAAGQLRHAIPVGRAAVRPGGAGLRSTAIVTAGIGVMMGLSLLGFLLAGRLPPHRVSAFSLLTILVGAFLLLREYAPRGKDSTVVAIAVFFGMVGLFKLMNRFESARPAQPPARPAAPPSGAAPGEGVSPPAPG
jgi:hypothetical protein